MDKGLLFPSPFPEVVFHCLDESNSNWGEVEPQRDLCLGLAAGEHSPHDVDLVFISLLAICAFLGKCLFACLLVGLLVLSGIWFLEFLSHSGWAVAELFSHWVGRFFTLAIVAFSVQKFLLRSYLSVLAISQKNTASACVFRCSSQVARWWLQRAKHYVKVFYPLEVDFGMDWDIETEPSSTHGCTVSPALFVKNVVFAPLYILGPFCREPGGCGPTRFFSLFSFSLHVCFSITTKLLLLLCSCGSIV